MMNEKRHANTLKPPPNHLVKTTRPTPHPRRQDIFPSPKATCEAQRSTRVAPTDSAFNDGSAFDDGATATNDDDGKLWHWGMLLELKMAVAEYYDMLFGQRNYGN